ncbi:MAG: F0F1 ATP synthase subunit B [Acidobacteriota bacterium]|jgi:F-type H+-transporting ATPase subunit b|nr:F0F1 ATP synthase subunit B [Acidobacteriota bacterium]
MLTWIVAPLPLAAAGGGGGSFLSVDTTLFVSTAILFAVFAWVLGKFAWGPLLRIVDDREKGIRDSVGAAERAAAEAKELLAQHQEMLRGAGREREEILAKALKEAETARIELVEKARSDAEHIVERARDQIERDKTQAIADLRGQVADIAVEAASKIVKSSLTPEVQKKLVDDYITSLPRA